MNDRLLQPSATSQEHKRTEMVKKNQQEYHLIGSTIARSGHTLFEYDKETHKVRRADIKRTMYVRDFKTGEVVFSNRCEVRRNCMYLQALNIKNAIKILRREGFEVINQ